MFVAIANSSINEINGQMIFICKLHRIKHVQESGIGDLERHVIFYLLLRTHLKKRQMQSGYGSMRNQRLNMYQENECRIIFMLKALHKKPREHELINLPALQTNNHFHTDTSAHIINSFSSGGYIFRCILQTTQMVLIGRVGQVIALNINT